MLSKRLNVNVPPQIGRYRVADQIGAGGMGIVYRAYDEKLRRDVAIKLLHHTSTESTARQVLTEARASSALNHPGICTVYEVEDTGDTAFIVMELVDGQPLSDVIPRDGFPSESVRSFGLQIADALAHAHNRSVVHRDVKPSNVLVTRHGRTKVLDFGLAQHEGAHLIDHTTGQLTSSEAGPVAGTLPYMAPEQLRGETATARSDVWSVGVLLYELACGRRPFGGTTPFALSASILSEPPPPLPDHVLHALRRVILRCLAKDPADRYQDAGQVHAALEAIEASGRTVGTRPTRRHSARTRVRSLAVLPLDNLSANPEEEYFADGMTDALITTLAQIGALRVISRTSVMRYKGTRRPLPEIAGELNVDAIVEGTVLRSQGRIRIATQLIHAATDTHIWAKQYETDLRDVLTLQSDVARAIAEEIRVQLSPREKSQLGKARQIDPVAYEMFLKGRHLWYKRNPDALTRAAEYLRQAIGLDQDYALAHAGLADAYVSLGWDLFGLASPLETYPKAKLAAERALELEPNCAEAHAAIGWIATGFDWDWMTAERGLRRAIELKPQYGPVHIWYSHFLRAMGRTDESLEESRRALECDPLGLVLNMHLGWHHLYSSQLEKAVEQCLKTLELDSTFIPARLFLGQSYEQLRMFSDAIAEFHTIVELSHRHPTYLAELGHGYAVSGRHDDALRTIDELVGMSSNRYVAARGIAEIYVALNDFDNAFAWLDKAFMQRNGWLIHIRENPRYEPIRAHARYVDLVNRMKFP